MLWGLIRFKGSICLAHNSSSHSFIHLVIQQLLLGWECHEENLLLSFLAN